MRHFRTEYTDWLIAGQGHPCVAKNDKDMLLVNHISKGSWKQTHSNISLLITSVLHTKVLLYFHFHKLTDVTPPWKQTSTEQLKTLREREREGVSKWSKGIKKKKQAEREGRGKRQIRGREWEWRGAKRQNRTSAWFVSGGRAHASEGRCLWASSCVKGFYGACHHVGRRLHRGG